MLKNTLLFITLLFTVNSFASNINKLTSDSSWNDINAANNIELKNTSIKVGNTRTSVFSVEYKDDMLYTLKPTIDGYYKRNDRGNHDNGSNKFIKTGESIKSGSITIQVPIYERKRINRDRDMQTLVGYKDYTQPLSRKIKVYKRERNGSNGNDRLVYLFEKDFSIPKKMNE